MALALSIVTTGAEAKDPIVITIDHAKVVRLPAPADTVIIGNPGIADATVHDRVTLVLTGKMTGVTNLIILDAKGALIAEETLEVAKIQAGLVTVQRASERFSYNCTPNCNTMMEVGDNQTFFDNAGNQIHKRNGLGQDSTLPQ